VYSAEVERHPGRFELLCAKLTVTSRSTTAARRRPISSDCRGGSGRAELARCLLIDYFDLHEQADEDAPLPVSYQEFKRDRIGRVSRDTREHAIDVETIDPWVRAQATRRP
jgi:hypothetical protein